MQISVPPGIHSLCGTKVFPSRGQFYKAHQSPVYLIPLIRVSRSALDVFLTAGIFAIWLSNGFEFSLVWNLMSINDAHCYARHLGSQILFFPSVKMHRPQTCPPQTHPPQTHPPGGNSNNSFCACKGFCLHVSSSVSGFFALPWVVSLLFDSFIKFYPALPFDPALSTGKCWLDIIVQQFDCYIEHLPCL